MRRLQGSVFIWVLLLGAAAAQAQTTGSISGRVTDTAGAPLADQWIYIYSGLANSYYTAAQTDPTGAFTFATLPTDTYYLESNPSSIYVPRFYGTSCPRWRCTIRDGTPVVVAAGQDVTGIDFVLGTGGSVAGHLFDAATSNPVPSSTSADARLYDEYGHFVATDFIYSSSNGYQFDRLPAGRYHLLIQAQSYSGYISELGDGRHCPAGCAVTAGAPFQVVEGATATLDVHLDRLGRIAGRLIDAATREPLTSGTVIVRSLDGRVVVNAYPQSPYYEYEALVPPGRYTVLGAAFLGRVPEFYGGVQAACDIDSFSVDHCAGLRRLASVVDVSAGGSRTGIDITLDAGGRIAGGITVAGPLSSSLTIRVLTPGGVVVRNRSVSAPGGYEVDSLPPGVYYVCAISPGNFRTRAFGGPEFPGDSCPASAGTPVTVVAGVSTPSIDFTMQPIRSSGFSSGTLSGRVRDSNGQPVRGSIRTFREDGTSWSGTTIATDGTYTTSIGPGSYFVRTEVYDNFVDEWLGGVCTLCGDARGELVTIAPGATMSNVDFELAPGGTIRGTVLPSSNFQVSAYDVTGRVMRTMGGFGGSVYSLTGLPAGTYYVRTTTRDPQYWIDVIYADTPCLSAECPLQAGTPVTVSAGQITPNINMTMRRPGFIRGRVTLRGAIVDARGDLLSPAVEAVDSRGAAAGTMVTRNNGYYEIYGLLPGTYYVRTVDAQKYGAVNQTWQAIQCPGCPVTDATPIQVLESRYTERIDFELEPGGSIAGLVVEAGSGAPLDNQRVEARSASGALVGSGLTTLDGSYVVEGLPDGSYFVQTVASTGHLDQRYHGIACVICQPGQGLPVVVASRGTVSGINFALVRGGRIAGRVTTGQVGIPNVPVRAVDAAGAVLGRAVSDATGSFILGAPAGTAYAMTEPKAGYVMQAFDRQTCAGGNCNLAAATPLAVPLGLIRSGVDFPLTACAAPSILPALLPASVVSHAYTATFTTSGGAAPYQYSLVSGDLPPGLSLGAASGVLNGALTQPGSYRFTVGATDASGCSAQQTFRVEVKGCEVSLSSDQLSFLSAGGQTTVRVSSGCPWQATSLDSWISATAGSGVAVIAVAPNPGGTRYGRVTIGGRSVAVSQASLTSGLPFGALDVPADGQTVRGSIAVGGWALDDVEVTRIAIHRDSVAPEPAGQLIYLGDAVRVRGARPDVETLFPGMPFRDRAGWGFLLLTNMLPNQGNGVFRLHAFAIDLEGHQALLGSRMIVAANATSTMPFGAIDTPGQGQTISGSAFVNFGWALTPLPKSIPQNGSTITVFIDGAAIGTVDYGHFRSDIATLFPGLNNSAGAVGFRMLDTTLLANGIHTISWAVTDDGGVTEGIGSRYFHVDNATPALTATRPLTAAPEPVPDASADSALRLASSRVVRIGEMQRLQLDLAVELATSPRCAVSYGGYEVVGEERRPLPAGSSLDSINGIFAWQPGPGFIGTYRLLFTATACDGAETARAIDVRIARLSR